MWCEWWLVAVVQQQFCYLVKTLSDRGELSNVWLIKIKPLKKHKTNYLDYLEYFSCQTGRSVNWRPNRNKCQVSREKTHSTYLNLWIISYLDWSIYLWFLSNRMKQRVLMKWYGNLIFSFLLTFDAFTLWPNLFQTHSFCLVMICYKKNVTIYNVILFFDLSRRI